MATQPRPLKVKDFTLDYSIFDADECRRIFTEFGVLVVQNAFSGDFCDAKVDEIVSFFEGLGTGVTRDDANTFTNEKIPYETRRGMYQGLVGNLPAVWELRTSDVIRRCFSALYRYDGKFIVSSDGFTLLPNCAYPRPKDWPHVDQTSDGMFKCIQGQAVLTNTSASFVCSPKSHLVHEELLDTYQGRSPGNFLMLEKNQNHLQSMRNCVREIGGASYSGRRP